MKIKKIPANYVAVRIDNPAYDQIKTKSGLELYIDPNFDFAKHVNHYGEVIAVPEKLIFDKEDPNRGLKWDTDMELCVGDTVWVDRMEVMIALGDKVKTNRDYKGMYPNKYIINNDGSFTLFVRYDCCWLRKRREEYYPLNGWLIIEPIKEKEYEGNIIIPKSAIKKYSTKFGKVLYSGNRIKEYQSDSQSDCFNIKCGDIVFLPKYGDITLENEMHNIFDKELFIVQRHRLVAAWNEIRDVFNSIGYELTENDFNKIEFKN